MEVEDVLRCLMQEYGVDEKYFDDIKRLADEFGLREVIRRLERLSNAVEKLERLERLESGGRLKSENANEGSDNSDAGKVVLRDGTVIPIRGNIVIISLRC